jgi:energy-converting hydrogenase Eha subunit C
LHQNGSFLTLVICLLFKLSLIHAVVNSKYFDLAIAGVIGSNVITMAMEYYMMPPVSEITDKYTILSIRLRLFLEN